MPLKKILFKPGVNRENTRYTTEGGWYDCDKIRVRQGNPESIGGWARYSVETFIGVCRSLWSWVTLVGRSLIGVGTSRKFYINQGGLYFDVSPIRKVVQPMLGAQPPATGNPFTATAGSSTIQVRDVGHGCAANDYVTYSGAVGLGGNVTADILNREYSVTVIDANNYTIDVSVTANATDASGSPGGGAAVFASYQVNLNPEIQSPSSGWGSSGWGLGGWGEGVGLQTPLQLWTQTNFGEDLIFAVSGGGIYYWDATVGLTPEEFTVSLANPAVLTFIDPHGLLNTTPVQLVTTGLLPNPLRPDVTYYVRNATANTFNLSATPTGALISTAAGSQSGVQSLSRRGIPLADLPGASDVPTIQNIVFVSDVSRFVFAFAANDPNSARPTAQDPMFIRWSDQEDPSMWTPAATNQAGSIRLSKGSRIVAAVQTRQEIVVFTDSAVYSLQYLGAPSVWGAQLLGDNISITSPNCVSVASGVVYWMGADKFYSYDGRIQTLNCDVRRYVFQDINLGQNFQIFSGTNEGFNEVWWFYCSATSSTVGKYVIYNYLEKIWYFGTLERSAWLDVGTLEFPIATTYGGLIVNHEDGINDFIADIPSPISAYISSSEFDIDDGHQFGFVWRVLPDLTFSDSNLSTSGALPQVLMTLYGLSNSGSGVTSSAGQSVIKGSTYVITEEFTGQIYTRVRGRQLIFKIESNQVNTAWQLGAPRIDIRPDGRR